MSINLAIRGLRLEADGEADSKRLLLIVLLGLVSAIEKRAIAEPSAGTAITWPSSWSQIAFATGYSTRIRELVIRVGNLFDIADLIPEKLDAAIAELRMQILEELHQAGDRPPHSPPWVRLLPPQEVSGSRNERVGEREKSLEMAVVEAEKRVGDSIVRQLREAQSRLDEGMTVPHLLQTIGDESPLADGWLTQHHELNERSSSRLLQLELENLRLKHIIAEQLLQLAHWEAPEDPPDTVSGSASPRN